MADQGAAAQTHEEIEAQIRDIQNRKVKKEAVEEDPEETPHHVAFGATGAYDTEIYGGRDPKFAGYVTSIAPNEDNMEEEDEESASFMNRRAVVNAPQYFIREAAKVKEEVDPFEENKKKQIASREDEYHARRRQMIISPERHDPFAG